MNGYFCIQFSFRPILHTHARVYTAWRMNNHAAPSVHQFETAFDGVRVVKMNELRINHAYGRARRSAAGQWSIKKPTLFAFGESDLNRPNALIKWRLNYLFYLDRTSLHLSSLFSPLPSLSLSLSHCLPFADTRSSRDEMNCVRAHDLMDIWYIYCRRCCCRCSRCSIEQLS